MVDFLTESLFSCFASALRASPAAGANDNQKPDRQPKTSGQNRQNDMKKCAGVLSAHHHLFSASLAVTSTLLHFITS